MEEELRWGREKLSLPVSRDGSTLGLRSRSPLPKSIIPLPGALTWLGQEPALSLGSEGGAWGQRAASVSSHAWRYRRFIAGRTG